MHHDTRGGGFNAKKEKPNPTPESPPPLRLGFLGLFGVLLDAFTVQFKIFSNISKRLLAHSNTTIVSLKSCCNPFKMCLG